MLVIVLCSLLWETTTKHMYWVSEASISHGRQLRSQRGRGREEAATLRPTTVHAADSGWSCVSLSIHDKSEPLVDSIVSERRGFAGRCPSYINA